ncbi:MAG: hypothetical protein FWD76_06445 [Firmicutes bacterium]|nr:hypothetical protein [Bacillota bacterium]
MGCDKFVDILARETGGKSYKSERYCLDGDNRAGIDCGDNNVKVTYKSYGETVQHKSLVDLTKQSLAWSDKRQVLSYFLDGSRRTYKVDHIGYEKSGKRMCIYPIVAGQIGIGCLQRKERKMSTAGALVREIVLAVPETANKDEQKGFFGSITHKMNEKSDGGRFGLKMDAVLDYKVETDKGDDEYEKKAIAKIQDRMVAKEQEFVAELVKERRLNQDNYLVKDGSIEYQLDKDVKNDPKKLAAFKQNYNYVLGISKQFNPSIVQDINGKSNPGFIVNLQPGHRTPVAKYENTRFGDIAYAVWYVRIRDKKFTRSPFDGVLKIEKMLVTDKEMAEGMDSETVDMLTSFVIAERNPVCYGSDARWANHLYPMYLTEQFVKSHYIGIDSFLQLF